MFLLPDANNLRRKVPYTMTRVQKREFQLGNRERFRWLPDSRLPFSRPSIYLPAFSLAPILTDTSCSQILQEWIPYHLN